MKISSVIISSAFLAHRPSASVSAFAAPAADARCRSAASSITRLHQFAETQQGGYVDVTDVRSPRDVFSMEEWAAQYGIQKADGVELYNTDGYGGNDYSLYTSSDVSASQTVVFVPADVVLNSDAVQMEFGDSLQQAEASLVQIDDAARFPQGAEYRLPLFRLMVKILVEYEKGTDGPYHPWLNSLPRQFFNGVSMTKACFKCLPPYAGWLTSNERINCSHFTSALKQGYVPLSQETIYNKEVTKWAYNNALTRFHESWQPERRVKVIGPVADMLNHASEPNCEISLDYDGNVNVLALRDVPAGSPLTVSLGDPTNPTPLFAKYGFLPEDCATIFCKAMQLEPRIRELGYDFAELVFQTETGEIAPGVWDVFLYDILQKGGDYDAAMQFCAACQNNDEGTKERYHSEYFAYTLDALKRHVRSILRDAKKLTRKAQSYDVARHPRVPVIVAHNQLVSRTFAMTATLLEQMG
mmetsp:Transcript_9026/g.19548  ORF Transcript_9026/g.19548 Transcript_9026/m.19548 type:complete len:470 (-) Transcript_9026:131-1540(-)|eukprot:CAMPEP_0172529308 /NCGR_PEP_ID=MMETSP1067-20121228/3420_1 /TAXON_ID=265564 ORGANISM="Thalassiosira punctigera, Strain Tpunct2005C2" /NCGR_SAMPLE_ID=MMETSP1067 /ASSEMBLY_ACC=CAM_ASM_000444 /LENGTH=469 /DNA_ID=CAMNT_0013313339 /DNA_START=29 /DNA_END=1438 /DNA_ORIENTATION=+